MGIFKQQSEIEMRHLPAVDRFKRLGFRVGVAKSTRLVILIKNIYT